MSQLVSCLHRVDTGSPAEGSGLKSGDQILGVNGHSFVSILHQEAVAILRAYTTLVLTVRVSNFFHRVSCDYHVIIM